MKELHTEIEIQAPPERVWQLLTDFADFPQWNPFIRRISGEAKAGARLEVHIQPSGAKGMTFRPKVLRLEPNVELRWLGRLLIPGLFDGEHIFAIEPLGADKVRFVQREIFKGVLVPLFASQLDTDTRRGFEEMNQALKTRAEQIV
ncbi:MAG: SRPBCC domain-containing protein [Candidatus Poribacteria bacterium]|nr:SRPBCC domain-containing protein [Candidatus Poribacteria bacterium]